MNLKSTCQLPVPLSALALALQSENFIQISVSARILVARAGIVFSSRRIFPRPIFYQPEPSAAVNTLHFSQFVSLNAFPSPSLPPLSAVAVPSGKKYFDTSHRLTVAEAEGTSASLVDKSLGSQ